MTDSDLANEFHRAMLGVYNRAKTEADYNATLFLTMISEHGGVEAARRLVMTSKPSDGFTALWESGRLDLTVEAHVLDPQFGDLFTRHEIEQARRRLAAYGYEA